MHKLTLLPEFNAALVFVGGFIDRDNFEMPLKGYRGDVYLEIEKEINYPLFFYDPTRIGQDVDYDEKNGKPCVAEPGMIVICEVTLKNIIKSVKYLLHEGFFDRQKPHSSSEIMTFFENNR
ncbi:MAG: hypothetical protein ACRC2T_19155 [Thermoguttaceae bacterium]